MYFIGSNLLAINNTLYIHAIKCDNAVKNCVDSRLSFIERKYIKKMLKIFVLDVYYKKVLVETHFN